MLRFGAQPARRRRPLFTSPGRGVWMLLVMLGAVLLLLRQLQQQATVDFLGRAFTPRPTSDSATPARPLPDSTGKRDGAWAKVQDNAMFLPAEQPAWEETFRQAADAPPEALAQRSLGEVAYAQFIAQPHVYRGEVVEVRGRVLRESLKRPAIAPAGVTAYHELIIAPAGGGEMPLACYCIELPEEFPRGAGLSEPVALRGIFFKNRSYLHDQGLGLMPVVVARTIDWQRPTAAPRPRPRSADRQDLLLGALAAAGAGVFFALWVRRQTKRPARPDIASPDFTSVEPQP